MDVQLDFSMRTAGVLAGQRVGDLQEEYQCVLQTVGDGLEAGKKTATAGLKIVRTSILRTASLCLQHNWMVVCSGSTSVQGTPPATALLTSLGSDSTPY